MAFFGVDIRFPYPDSLLVKNKRTTKKHIQWRIKERNNKNNVMHTGGRRRE